MLFDYDRQSATVYLITKSETVIDKKSIIREIEDVFTVKVENYKYETVADKQVYTFQVSDKITSKCVRIKSNDASNTILSKDIHCFNTTLSNDASNAILSNDAPHCPLFSKIDSDHQNPYNNLKIISCSCKSAISYKSFNPLPSYNWNDNIEMWTCHNTQLPMFDQFKNDCKRRTVCKVKTRSKGILYGSFHFIADLECFSCGSECRSGGIKGSVTLDSGKEFNSEFVTLDSGKVFDSDGIKGAVTLDSVLISDSKSISDSKRKKSEKIIFYNQVITNWTTSEIIFYSFLNHFKTHTEYHIAQYEIILIAQVELYVLQNDQKVTDHGTKDHKTEYDQKVKDHRKYEKVKDHGTKYDQRVKDHRKYEKVKDHGTKYDQRVKDHGTKDHKTEYEKTTTDNRFLKRKALRIGIRSVKNESYSDLLNEFYKFKILNMIERQQNGLKILDYQIGYITL